MKFLLIATILLYGQAFSVSNCSQARREVLKYNKGQSSIKKLANGKDNYRYRWLASSTQSFNRLTTKQINKPQFTLRLKKLNTDANCVIRVYNRVLTDKIIEGSSTTLNKFQDHLRSDATKHTDLGGLSNQFRDVIIDHYHYMSMIEQF